MWSYEEALAWLYERQRLGIKLGLEKVDRLLSSLGDPQRSFHSVHIAGTNGKGSVTRMLAEVLRRAGMRTGSTTSPHLVSFTERVQLDGQDIEPQEVARLLEVIRPHVEVLDATEQPPTFFEVVTAMAFLHFHDCAVQWAVVETGMGGRLDATNVLEPAVTIITNVDLDHQEHLGNTVGEIAYEKSGIMKRGVPCVTAARGEALLVLKAQSPAPASPRSPWSCCDPRGNPTSRSPSPARTSRRTPPSSWPPWRPCAARACPSPTQRLPTACASHATPDDSTATTSRRTPWPRSCPPRMCTSSWTERTTPPARMGWSGFDLVVGFNADKEWEEMLEQWAPSARRVWAVPLRNPRSLDPGHIVDAVQAMHVPAQAMPDARSALAAATRAGGRRILVAGSLYLAGEALAVLSGRSLEAIRGTQ
jgi:dihydrofolate synthase / folylpolyglutamate synthase